jgi:hypothetical protein
MYQNEPIMPQKSFGFFGCLVAASQTALHTHAFSHAGQTEFEGILAGFPL